MESRNKGNFFAAIAGAVVGAGAVIASVAAMKDKSNQKKVDDLVEGTKDLVGEYKKDVTEQVKEGKKKLKEVANKAIKTAEKITNSAKKEVKNI